MIQAKLNGYNCKLKPEMKLSFSSLESYNFLHGDQITKQTLQNKGVNQDLYITGINFIKKQQ